MQGDRQFAAKSWLQLPRSTLEKNKNFFWKIFTSQLTFCVLLCLKSSIPSGLWRFISFSILIVCSDSSNVSHSVNIFVSVNMQKIRMNELEINPKYPMNSPPVSEMIKFIYFNSLSNYCNSFSLPSSKIVRNFSIRIMFMEVTSASEWFP